MITTSLLRRKTINRVNLETIFPFLLFILVGIAQLILKKKKGKAPSFQPKTEQPIPLFLKESQIGPFIPPPAPLKKASPSCIKTEEEIGQKKQEKRIQRLVKKVGSKQELFLLSEILKRPKY
jgi:hypothetical protein